MTRLVLIDDHRLFLEALRSALEARPEFQLVGTAGTSRDAYRVVEEGQPDVVLLDVSLDGPSGISVARELQRRSLPARILMLSMHVDEAYAADALAAGAHGYATKLQSIEELAEAIQTVAAGGRYLPPTLSSDLVDEKLQALSRKNGASGALAALSPREREVFDLLVHGFSNDGIGGQLCISPKTVETHRTHILAKLRLHSLAELVRFAATHGLLRD